jgi:hypothetical protein
LFEDSSFSYTVAARCLASRSWIEMLALWFFTGLAFGSVAGLSAFLITYREYEQHKMERPKLMRHSLSSALFAFLYFLISALIIGYALSHTI